MIVKLDLEKTYGRQNEDIAKKNKINSVTINVAEVSEQGTENYQTFSQTISSEENSSTRIDAIWKEDWWKGDWVWQECKVKNPTYLIEVLYKTYTISASKSEYPTLQYMRNVPKHSIGLNGSAYIQSSDTKIRLESVENVTDFYQYFYNLELEYPLFSSSDYTANTYDISQNEYTTPSEVEGVEDTQTDIFSNISTFVQNGLKNTKDEDINSILEYTNPKIIKVLNSSDIVSFVVRCPYKIKMFRSDDCGCDDSEWITSRHYGQIKEFRYDEYSITSADIVIYSDLSFQSSEQSFFSGNRVYSAEESFLFNTETYMYYNDQNTYPNIFATDIVEKYENGKLKLNIKYPVVPLRDNLGNSLFYVEDVGLCRKVNNLYFEENGNIVNMDNEPNVSDLFLLDENTLFVIVRDGVPVYTNRDRTPKYFVAQVVNSSYNGVLINELTLIESSYTPSKYMVVYDSPNHSVVEVSSLSYDGYDIPSGAGIASGATLHIDISFDYGYGLVGNLLDINGEKTTERTWIVDSDVKITPEVVYLGGKKVSISKSDSGYTLTVLASPVGGTGVYEEIQDGAEIFTNQHIIIKGTIENGYSGALTINGIEQEFELNSANKNTFDIDYFVEDSDLNIVLVTENVQKTITLNADTGSTITATVKESKWNPSSVGNSLASGDTVCVGDYLQILFSSEEGYDFVSYGVTSGATQIDYPDVNIFEVTDNVVVETVMEQDLSEFERKLYSYRISIPTTVANIYSVNRVSSLYDVPLGNIDSVLDEADSSGYRYYYPVYVGDVLEITARGNTGYAVSRVSAGPLGGNKTVLKTPSTMARSYKFEYTVSDSVEFVVAGEYMGATLRISGSGGTVRRSSSEYGGSTSSLTSGSTIYVGDVLRVSTSSSSVRVTNNLKFVSAGADYDNYRFATDSSGSISDATITFS